MVLCGALFLQMAVQPLQKYYLEGLFDQVGKKDAEGNKKGKRHDKIA